MKRSTLVLGMLLAISLLFNVVAFVRLGEREASKRSAQGPPKPPPASPVVEPVGTARALEQTAPVAREVSRTPPSSPSPNPKTAAAPPVALASVRNDPKVLEVLEAQDSFSAFWKDLDRVFKARNKFDEPKYVQTVLTATEDYLELSEQARVQFGQAAQTAAGNLGLARKDYDAARKALPPKDKGNPTAYAAIQQQRDAIDIRYQEQVRAAVETLKVSLDPKLPRHLEFASNAEKWLRNLVPKPSKP